MLNVDIVENKLERLKVLTKSIVVKTVEIRDMLARSIQKNIVKRLVNLLKERSLKTLGGLVNYTQCGTQTGQTKEKDLLINIEIGDMRLLNVINGLAKYVEIKGQAVRIFVLTTLNHFQLIQNYVTKLVMVEYCVTSATEKQILIAENDMLNL